MKLLCLSTKLSDEQAQKIWSQKPQFREIKDFGLTTGQNYWVYGITILGGEPWVYVLSPSEYLHPVPLCLFRVIDGQVSKYWIANLDLQGNLEISYPTIVDNPYYLDKLSESNPATVEDFQRIQQLLSAEFEDAKEQGRH